MRSNYQCLGAIVGDDDVVASLFKAAGEGVQKVVDYEKGKSASEAQEKSDRASLDAAVAADQEAAAAVAQALFSANAKLPSAAADQAAAQIAIQAEDAAAEGLSPDNQKRRADAAHKALAQATAAWQAATRKKDAVAVKQAEYKVAAAEQVHTKAQNAMFVDVAKRGGELANHPGAQPGPAAEGTRWGLVAAIGAGALALGGGLLWWLRSR